MIICNLVISISILSEILKKKKKLIKECQYNLILERKYTIFTQYTFFACPNNRYNFLRNVKHSKRVAFLSLNYSFKIGISSVFAMNILNHSAKIVRKTQLFVNGLQKVEH